MRDDLILVEMLRQTWAIDQRMGDIAVGIQLRRARGEPVSMAELQAVRAARDARGYRPSGVQRGGIAVLPLIGVIMPKVNLMTEFSGGTSCANFTAQLRDALTDDAVSQILIDIDSPGGDVRGVPELACEIMQARTQKPVIGIANDTAASAAYWLGACCSELYASPSASVGSIGVYVVQEDISAALQQQGARTTTISVGKFKVEGGSTEPLDDEARAYVQKQVDEVYRTFTAHVARGRNVPLERVRSGFGQGSMLTADAALAETMVDGVMTFAELVADMQRRPRGAQQGRCAKSARAQAIPSATMAAPWQSS